MQIINKHSLTVLEVTSRERGEEFKGAEWVELQSYVSALRAERDELRTELEGAYKALKIALKCNHFTDDEYTFIGEWTDSIRAILAKYEVTK